MAVTKFSPKEPATEIHLGDESDNDGGSNIAEITGDNNTIYGSYSGMDQIRSEGNNNVIFGHGGNVVVEGSYNKAIVTDWAY